MILGKSAVEEMRHMIPSLKELMEKYDSESVHAFVYGYNGNRVLVSEVLEKLKKAYPDRYDSMRTVLKTEYAENIDGDYFDFTDDAGVLLW